MLGRRQNATKAVANPGQGQFESSEGVVFAGKEVVGSQ